MASPFPSGLPKNEQELIKPAVEGTRNVLLACIEHKIKKVVVTSSVAAVSSGREDKNEFNDTD